MTRHPVSPRSGLFASVLLALALTGSAHAADAPQASSEIARRALAVLQSPDSPPEEKAIACKRLGVFGGPEAVPALAPLLADERLSSWARIPLEVIPGTAADDALRDAMGRLYGNLLVGTINSVGVRRDPKAVEPLIGRLKDPNAEVGAAAGVALGRIGGSRAVSALQNALSDSPMVVRSGVAEGLILCAEHALASGQNAEAAKLYDTLRRADLPPQRILEATRGAIVSRQSDGLPLLLEALRSPDRDTFDIGLRTSRELPGQAITEALAAELNRAPADRQGRLLIALTDRRDPAVQPAVLGAVKQGSKSLRLVAIGVLERQANATSIPVLLEAAADSDSEVSKAAQTALGRLPGKDLDALVMARLSQSSGPTRRVLVDLAGQRHLAAAVPDLVKAAATEDADLRSAAITALGETVNTIDLEALTSLLAKNRSEDDLAEIEAALDSAVTRLADKAASGQALLARFPTSDAPMRCALLRVFGSVGTPDTLAAVRSSLTHTHATVRDAAFRVLANWPESAAIPALMGVIRTPANDTQRTLALRGAVRLLGLGDQSAPQALKAYAELLPLASRVDDRKLVLSGLGAVADPAAIRLVEPLLADAAVRKEAESALIGIAGAIAGTAPAEAKALATKLAKDASDNSIRTRAAQLLETADKFGDYITSWQFAGAYTLASGESGSLFAKEFPPEKGDTNVKWRPLPAGTQSAKPYMLDLLATKTGETGCAGYARTWVHSDIATPVRAEFGTDDGHKLWCNGEPIAQADRGGAATPGEFKSIVSLRQGWNLLLLKVVQDTGPWEFCLRLRTPSGGKLDGLRIQAQPPTP